MTIGERIKKLRKANGLTQKQLAERCGYSSLTTINKIELGINSVPISVVEKIAKVLGCTPSFLLGWDNGNEEVDPFSFPNIFEVEKRRIPLLGEIACGEPIFCNEDRESYVEIGTDTRADFCLKCKGDSMIGARIHDGDIVFIRQQDMVNNGEIAAVIIDNEATLKRVFYYPEKGKLVLQSENPKYEPFVYGGEELNDIKILGKAIAFQSDVL